jgi:hypothetical protein
MPYLINNKDIDYLELKFEPYELCHVSMICFKSRF